MPLFAGPAVIEDRGMVIIRFADAETERKALGYLAGRFTFKSWASGETMVPEAVLPILAREGIRFSMEAPAGMNDSIGTPEAH
jgi:hypothetical protein